MARILELHGEIAGLTAGAAGNLTSEGVSTHSGIDVMLAADFTVVGAHPREDANGNGGDYAIGNIEGANSPEMITSFTKDPNDIVGKTVVECFYRIPIQKPTAASDFKVYFQIAGTGHEHGYVSIDNAGALAIITNSTIRATLAGVVPTVPGDYPVLTVWVKIDTTAGWVRVYKDFDYSAPILQWEGATYDTFPGGALEVHDQTQWDLHHQETTIDDVVVNDITMTVTPTGTFTVGMTITGALTGTTGVITRVDAVTGSSDVSLQLTELVLTGSVVWDGNGDPFSTETSVSNGGVTGVPINSGLDPNSSLPANSYFAKALQPDGQGNISDLDTTPVNTDGDQWENVAYDGVGGTTYLGLGADAEVSYNSDAVGNAMSTYTLGDHGIAAADIGAVLAVRVFAWARKDGVGVDDVELVVRSGTTNGFSPLKGLGAVYGVRDAAFLTDPDTSSAWDPDDVESIEAGSRFQ